MKLEGRVALVSGGSTGIGAAVVRRFAEEGALVALGDVNVDDGTAVAKEVEAAGGVARFHPLDVTKADEWRRMVDDVVAEHGRLDILVNNAAIHARTPIEELSEDEWDLMLDINAKGVFLGTKAAIPAMRASGGGSIVNLSSTAGLIGSLSIHYGASKGAVRLMSKSIAKQCAKDGIRCNSVHPGPVDTAMGRSALPEGVREERLKRVPLGRFAQPEEIAGAIFFLASDDSSYITGTEVVVDGGLSGT